MSLIAVIFLLSSAYANDAKVEWTEVDSQQRDSDASFDNAFESPPENTQRAANEDRMLMLESELLNMQSKDISQEMNEEQGIHKKEKPRLLNELAEIQESSRKTKTQLEGIQGRIRNMQLERDELEKRIEDSKKNHARLRLQVQQENTRMRKLKAALDERYKEFHAQKTQFMAHQREQNLIKERQELFQAEVREVQNKIQRRKRELEETHRDVILAKDQTVNKDKLMKRMIERNERELQVTTGRIADMKKQLLNMIGKNPKLMAKLDQTQQERTQLEKELEELRVKVSKVKMERNAQKREIASTQGSMASSQEDLDLQKAAYRKEVEKFSNDVRAMRQQLQELDLKIIEIQRASLDYKRANDEMARRKSVLKNQIRDRKGLLKELDEGSSQQPTPDW